MTVRSPWRGDLNTTGPNKAFGPGVKSHMRLFNLGYFVEAKGHWGFAFEDRHEYYELT